MKPPLVCYECKKPTLPARCRGAVKLSDGKVEVVCFKCWRELGYEAYLYEHHEP